MDEKLVLAGVKVPTLEEVLALGKYEIARVKSFYWNCPICDQQMWGHNVVERHIIRSMEKAGQPLYEQHQHEIFAAALKAEIEAHLEGHEETTNVQ